MIACRKQFHDSQYHEIDSGITKSYLCLELIFTCIQIGNKTENHILINSMSTHGYEWKHICYQYLET